MFLKKAPPEPPASQPVRRFTDVAEPTKTTVLAPKIRVNGDIVCEESIDLAGNFEGTIKTQGLCRLRQGGRVLGRVHALHVVIEGEIEGEIVARGKVELGASANVQADIRTATIAIAEGCFFDGRIHMEGAHGDFGSTTFVEKRKSTQSARRG
ncbi:MAG: polymer-forming cytoskeletal protein [Vicinamibacteria bacterium]|jgi:cytoskeletal protein CcmA (bactofilin family)|nr:polymer-forming cytoskeletal protein [Vicinamibacteria bacterium]